MADYPDFEGDKSGLFPIAEWAAKEGNEKLIFEDVGAGAFGALDSVEYLIPASKTLYIVSISIAAYATNAADGDKQAHYRVEIRNVTTAVILDVIGGNGGGMYLFVVPHILEAGDTVRLTVQNRSNFTAGIMGRLHCYEV